jgi:hypothetical protein
MVSVMVIMIPVLVILALAIMIMVIKQMIYYILYYIITRCMILTLVIMILALAITIMVVKKKTSNKPHGRIESIVLMFPDPKYDGNIGVLGRHTYLEHGAPVVFGCPSIDVPDKFMEDCHNFSHLDGCVIKNTPEILDGSNIYIYECEEYWVARGITPVSSHNIRPVGKVALVFGTKNIGLSKFNDTFPNGSFVAVFIPQTHIMGMNASMSVRWVAISALSSVMAINRLT